LKNLLEESLYLHEKSTEYGRSCDLFPAQVRVCTGIR
jgi:hypothetical protein